MSYDPEKSPAVPGYIADDKAIYIDAHSTESPEPVLYNNTYISQDNGFFSRLRSFEARLDKKLGIESEAIDRKRAEDKGPVPWHQQLTMALLWASG